MRATWDETWLAVADAMAARSLCVNRQVGAVIVDRSNRPVSVGYNGAPAGFPVGGESCAARCPRANSTNRTSSYANCFSVHAEANALIFADRRHYQGGTIYVTNPCCWDCSKLVANSGIFRVVFKVSESDSHAAWRECVDFMRDCGLVVEYQLEKKETEE